MKKTIRILSVALVAVMVLSLAAVASAATPSVYIPGRLAKLVDAYVDDYVFPTLVTKTDTAWNAAAGEYTANTDSGVTHFYFSEKPDWFGAVVSSKDGGWISIDIDDSGYGELELEGLARQPGTWSWNGVAEISYKVDEDGNPVTDEKGYYVEDWDNARLVGEGRSLNKYEKAHNDAWHYVEDAAERNKRYPFYQQWHSAGGDYPYQAGKDYGDYSVTVNYHRNGGVYQVAVTLKNTDLFNTGIEGAESTITFELVNVQLDSLRWIEVPDENGEITYVLKDPTDPESEEIPVNTNRYGGRVTMMPTYDDEGKVVPDAYIPVASRRINGPYAKYLDTKNDLYKTKLNPQGYTILAYGPLSSTDVWYISSVSATYPEGNPIVAVEADYRNDAKNNLYGYKVSYAVSETEVYEITYTASNKPVFGLYAKNGVITAVSGSGNNINKWYKYNGTGSLNGKLVYNNGKQVKNVKKGINSFSSPRVTVK